MDYLVAVVVLAVVKPALAMLLICALAGVWIYTFCK